MLRGLTCIWDAEDGKLLMSSNVHQSGIGTLAWSPDGKRIASGDTRGHVKILDSETLEEVLTLHDGLGFIKQLAWSPDGRQLAGIDLDGQVIIWNANCLATPAVVKKCRDYGSNGLLNLFCRSVWPLAGDAGARNRMPTKNCFATRAASKVPFVFLRRFYEADSKEESGLPLRYRFLTPNPNGCNKTQMLALWRQRNSLKLSTEGNRPHYERFRSRPCHSHF